MNIRIVSTAVFLASLALAGCGPTAATAPSGAVDPDPLTTTSEPGQLIGDPLLQNQDEATMETLTGN